MSSTRDVSQIEMCPNAAVAASGSSIHTSTAALSASREKKTPGVGAWGGAGGDTGGDGENGSGGAEGGQPTMFAQPSAHAAKMVLDDHAVYMSCLVQWCAKCYQLDTPEAV